MDLPTLQPMTPHRSSKRSRVEASPICVSGIAGRRTSRRLESSWHAALWRYRPLLVRKYGHAGAAAALVGSFRILDMADMTMLPVSPQPVAIAALLSAGVKLVGDKAHEDYPIQRLWRTVAGPDADKAVQTMELRILNLMGQSNVEYPDID